MVLLMTTTLLNFPPQHMVQAQTCTANAGSTPTSPTYLCPLGYINTRTSATTWECKKATDMQTSVVNQKSCQTSADCALNPNDDTSTYASKLLVTCSNGKCVYSSSRLAGDSCSWSGQCLGGRCDLLTGKCVSTLLNTARKDQRCEVVLANEGQVISCQENTGESLKCYTDVTIQSTPYKSCYAKKTVPVGIHTCMALLEDGSSCSTHKECKSGDCQLSDVNDPQSAYICKKLKGYGELCDSTTECSNAYACRSTDAKSSRRCLPFAELGEFCNTDSDCRYNKPFTFGSNTVVNTLVVCSVSKCIRAFGQGNGQRCELNTHCYTGFCDQQTGNCANPPVQKCTAPAPNDNCPYCACKDGSGEGTCVTTNNCPGYKLDLQICVYNNFVNSLTDPLANSYYNLVARSAMDSLFVDRESSIYTKCRSYFTNYWSCMQNNDKWTVAEFEGFVPGVQPVPNLIMPKVLSGASGLSSSLVLLIMIILVVALLQF
ncbi:hypothetical protein C9374_013377 [Naegleria lovaniensis]|uniref:Uncharacterized protein n=1 Tax=Naegleria lovaniensis TaxID=51637 RepID=A0AA88H272_NAELO|nr:uncharacterized protein C9374_013377 [Naegleria lovaniensis]KAG2391892.1 hypothetical protein C9374_013377 [Naegleria lovaniensis]